jgi:nucleotide-binding universal stress UspA family protein
VSVSAKASNGVCLIVGYDRSDGARLAAAWAARHLSAEGKLVVVYSCRPLHTPASPLSTPEERHQLGRAVIDELLLDDEDSLFDLEIETEISDRDPVSALIDAAQNHHAQGIVVGHAEHSRLRKVLGTVTSELLNTSPVPVITVPATAAELPGLTHEVRSVASVRPDRPT